MPREQIHWVAGPVGYGQSDQGLVPNLTVITCKWEFVGGTASGELRRWNLCFSIQTRQFTVNQTSVSRWERVHQHDLSAFYRPVAILRHMLPKGSLATALRAMLNGTYDKKGCAR